MDRDKTCRNDQRRPEREDTGISWVLVTELSCIKVPVRETQRENVNIKKSWGLFTSAKRSYRFIIRAIGFGIKFEDTIAKFLVKSHRRP